MAFVGAAHVLCGLLFLFLSARATECLVIDPPPRSVLLVRGLGGILIAFGTMNIMARRGENGPALRAVLAGTLLYLVFTTAFDVRWVLCGLLTSAAWLTIAIRGVFAVAYARALWKLRA